MNTLTRRLIPALLAAAFALPAAAQDAPFDTLRGTMTDHAGDIMSERDAARAKREELSKLCTDLGTQLGKVFIDAGVSTPVTFGYYPPGTPEAPAYRDKNGACEIRMNGQTMAHYNRAADFSRKNVEALGQRLIENLPDRDLRKIMQSRAPRP